MSEIAQLRCAECKTVWTTSRIYVACPVCGSMLNEPISYEQILREKAAGGAYNNSSKTTVYDAVERPLHYIGHNGIEAIDVIEGFELDFKIGNAVTYLLRAGKKGNADDHVRDLEKAQRYISRRIKQLKGEKGW